MSGVTLTSHAYRQLDAEARRSQDGTETGGLLLGSDMGMGAGFCLSVSAETRGRTRFASQRVSRAI